MLMVLLAPQPQSKSNFGGVPIERRCVFSVLIPQFGSSKAVRSPDAHPSSSLEFLGLRPVIALGEISNLHVEVQPLNYSRDFGPSKVQNGVIMLDLSSDDLNGLGDVKVTLKETEGSQLWLRSTVNPSDSILEVQVVIESPINSGINWGEQKISLTIDFKTPRQIAVAGTEVFWNELSDSWDSFIKNAVPNTLSKNDYEFPLFLAEISPEGLQRSLIAPTLLAEISFPDRKVTSLGVGYFKGSFVFPWFRTSNITACPEFIKFREIAKGSLGPNLFIFPQRNGFVIPNLENSQSSTKSLVFRLEAETSLELDKNERIQIKDCKFRYKSL